MGCHDLLQGIFPTQGSNPVLPHCRWILYHLGHQGSPKCQTRGEIKYLFLITNHSVIESVPRGLVELLCGVGFIFIKLIKTNIQSYACNSSTVSSPVVYQHRQIYLMLLVFSWSGWEAAKGLPWDFTSVPAFSSCGKQGLLSPPWLSLLQSTSSRANRLQQPWCTGLAALWDVGSSRTRDRTCVPCTGRRILNHWTTREDCMLCFFTAASCSFTGTSPWLFSGALYQHLGTF